MEPEQEVANWREYCECVKAREEKRMEAERLEKARRAAWREYYKIDGRIKELDIQLGINEVAEADDDCPPAPKKLKFKRKE